MTRTHKEILNDKALRMAEIRKNRRAAGFSEVTLWLPEEEAGRFREMARVAVEAVSRDFPHRAKDTPPHHQGGGA